MSPSPLSHTVLLQLAFRLLIATLSVIDLKSSSSYSVSTLKPRRSGGVFIAELRSLFSCQFLFLYHTLILLFMSPCLSSLHHSFLFLRSFVVLHHPSLYFTHTLFSLCSFPLWFNAEHLEKSTTPPVCVYVCQCVCAMELHFLSSELFWDADFLFSDDERQMFWHHSLSFFCTALPPSPFLSLSSSLYPFLSFPRFRWLKPPWFWSKEDISACYFSVFLIFPGSRKSLLQMYLYFCRLR